MKERPEEAIRRLWGVTEEDLRVANMCLAVAPPSYLTAALHAQQAAEKALRAWGIALGGGEPPLGSSLLDVAARIAAHGGPSLPHPTLQWLDRFAPSPRCDVIEVSLSEAQRALSEAQAFVHQAQRAIHAQGQTTV